MSPQKWTVSTNAKGMMSKSGRYGGTFAHIEEAILVISFNLCNLFQKRNTASTDRCEALAGSITHKIIDSYSHLLTFKVSTIFNDI